jgi:hypothetical protein
MSTIIFCVFWALLAYVVAKKKGQNVVLWTALGLVLGPIPLIILAFKKKNSGTSDSNTSFADQAVDGIRTLRYSVDNISSKIAESSQGQSASKISGAMKDAFKKR